jgi:cytoskeletal protein CcmA (bactofilin family)
VVVVGVSDGVVVLTTGGAVVVGELSAGELVAAGCCVVDGVVITVVELLKVGGSSVAVELGNGKFATFGG